MKNKKQALYDTIDIPKELDEMINKTIETVNDERKEEKSLKQANKMFKGITAAVVALILFALPLNMSQTFAQAAKDLPVIGVIANLLTFRTYTYENEISEGNINIPEIDGLSDAAYQEKVNEMIQVRVEALVEASKNRAEEYKKAYLETGGTEEEYAQRKVEVKTDYKLFTNKNGTLSFLVYTYDTVASAYAVFDYYNIDVTTNEELCFNDLLGEDYQEIIIEATNSYIQETKDEIGYFEDALDGSWHENFNKDMDFYINDDQEVVVVYTKYELAAGAFGRLEVPIKEKTN